MATLLEQYPLICTLALLVIAPVVTFCLRQACSICQANIPSYTRALADVVLTVPLTYFVFDLAAYVLMRLVSEAGVEVPPDYSYGEWLGESLQLKWAAIGLIPGLRYLMVVIALCVAGILQVLVLHVTFRVGVLILALHVTFTLATLGLLALLMALQMGAVGPEEEIDVPEAAAAPSRLVITRADLLPSVEDLRSKLSVAIPKVDEKGTLTRGEEETSKGEDKEKPAPAAKETETSPKVPAPVRRTRTPMDRAERFLGSIRDRFDPYLESVRESSAPVTQQLPPPVQHFLDAGGWWLVVGGLALLSGMWLGALRERYELRLNALPERQVKRSRTDVGDVREDLETLPPFPGAPGPQRLTVKGLPARVRLIVLAPAGRDLADLAPELADTLLDWIRPGLSALVEHDAPQVRVWGRQYSPEGFARSFHNNLRCPDPEGARSRWVLVDGTVVVGRQRVHLGLALYCDQPNTIRHVTLSDGQWLDVLGVREPAS